MDPWFVLKNYVKFCCQLWSKDEQQYGVKRIRRPFIPGRPGQKFPRDKFAPEVRPEIDQPEVFSPRPPMAPIDNEIPDSANVKKSPSAGADEPQPVESEGRQAKLNLGKKYDAIWW